MLSELICHLRRLLEVRCLLCIKVCLETVQVLLSTLVVLVAVAVENKLLEYLVPWVDKRGLHRKQLFCHITSC